MTTGAPEDTKPIDRRTRSPIDGMNARERTIVRRVLSDAAEAVADLELTREHIQRHVANGTSIEALAAHDQAIRKAANVLGNFVARGPTV